MITTRKSERIRNNNIKNNAPTLLSSPINKTSKNKSLKKRNKTESVASNQKITKWLKISNKNETTSINPVEEKPNKKTQKSTSSTKLQRSESFEKYGILLPSYEKIQADQKLFQEHSKNMEIINRLAKNCSSFDLPKTVPSSSKLPSHNEKLNCKHVDLETLEKYFIKHLSVLESYANATKRLERHDQFMKNILNPLNCTDDYICFVVFTYEQKDFLLKLLTDKFSKNKPSDYIFKVLLPELCLLIFMDEHIMNKRQANAYLKNYPMED